MKMITYSIKPAELVVGWNVKQSWWKVCLGVQKGIRVALENEFVGCFSDEHGAVGILDK
jgi:hypothetical protein